MIYLIIIIGSIIYGFTYGTIKDPIITIVLLSLFGMMRSKLNKAEEKMYADRKAHAEAVMAAAKAEQVARSTAKTAVTHTTATTVKPSPVPTQKNDFDIEVGTLTAYNAKAETAVIPNNVTSIGDYAFKNVSELKRVIIPDSVKHIGKEAFVDCKKLLRADVPNSVVSIGDGAFLRCNHLEIVALPNSVRNIGNNTFLACKNLMDISMPENLVMIGEQAFYGCANLQNITIPNSVKSVGKSAFSECKKLESISIPDSITAIQNKVFSNCHQLGNVTLPSGIVSIGEEAFYHCYSLRNIKLPNSLKTIGTRAFAHCESLRSIDIPDGVTDIEGYAFAGCDNLTSISIPDSVTFIGDGVFNGCSELLTIRAAKGSAAERYATRNDIRFSAVVQDKNVPVIHEIDFADFVVRSNAFSCYFKHDVETVQAFVNVLSRDGSIRKAKTIAAYCKDCNCYYILDSSFKALQKQGVILCQLITLAELKGKGFSVFSGEGMKAQSMLRRCGYTVNATDDLSATQRQKILALVLDNRIYSASELYNFLDWLIGYHGRSRQRDMSAAIEKWTDDRNFVANYKAGLRRSVGINSISYRE